jgi:2-polyprenyl-6-hydroxyphenyl methylase/3-demethylubiquinone-9 3-methyltransferase
VLDVGCGGGILAESMARRGADVLGIDMGEAPLAVGRLHAQQDNVQNIEYRQIPVEQLAQEQAGQYDVVTCMEMMEHVPDPASIVKACQALVKPGGHVFFSTLNRNPKSYLFAVIGAEYVLRMLPRGTHDYAKFITPAELSQFARLAGLQVDGMDRPPAQRGATAAAARKAPAHLSFCDTHTEGYARIRPTGEGGGPLWFAPVVLP